ncbi:MAG: hypothetical protein KIS92_05440 [Planctomycetota bacterium]|nr:hypothetical protein [Planctomycetota bacterium]
MSVRVIAKPGSGIKASNRSASVQDSENPGLPKPPEHRGPQANRPPRTSGPLHPIGASRETRAPAGRPVTGQTSVRLSTQARGLPSTATQRPGSPTSGRISLAGIGQGYWHCAKCRKDLPKDALVKKLADLSDGTLICTECRGGGKKAAKPAGLKALYLPLAGLVALTSALAVVLPGYVLFALMLGSAGLILLGALGFTMRNVVRFILVGLGLCGLVVGVWSVMFLKDRQAQADEEADVRSAASDVDAALKKQSYLEAQSCYRRFMALAMPTPGVFRSPQAELAATQIRESMDKWLKDAYGALSPKEASLLVNLMSLYGEKSLNGKNRFAGLKVAEEAATLRFVSDADPAAKDEADEKAFALERARSVMKTLYGAFPAVQHLELSLAVDGGAGEPKELGTLVVKPGQETLVTMGGDLSTLLRK